MKKACKHMNFEANVNVVRITDRDGGPVKRYVADLTVRCSDCSQDFEFIGMVPGLLFSEPSCGWTPDGRPEARIPIRPASNLRVADVSEDDGAGGAE